MVLTAFSGLKTVIMARTPRLANNRENLAKIWHNVTLSRIEMKSKTILNKDCRNGKRDTI
jgi:hypothetical protein